MIGVDQRGAISSDDAFKQTTPTAPTPVCDDQRAPGVSSSNVKRIFRIMNINSSLLLLLLFSFPPRSPRKLCAVMNRGPSRLRVISPDNAFHFQRFDQLMARDAAPSKIIPPPPRSSHKATDEFPGRAFRAG